MSTRRTSGSRHNEQPPKRRRLASPRDYGDDGGGHRPGSRNLACHFYKRFPTHFTRCLFRNHLTSTSFTVQHIYRCHSQHCSRAFGEATERDGHLRQQTYQEASPPRRNLDCGREGLDRRRLVELDQRPRRGLTEIERWYAIWDIIFPSTPRPESPYVSSPEDEILCITRRAIKLVCPPGNCPQLLDHMNWSTISSALETTSSDQSSDHTPSEPDSLPLSGPPTPPTPLGLELFYLDQFQNQPPMVQHSGPLLDSYLNPYEDHLTAAPPLDVGHPDHYFFAPGFNFHGVEKYPSGDGLIPELAEFD